MLPSLVLAALGLALIFLEFFLPGGVCATVGMCLIAFSAVSFFLLEISLFAKITFVIGGCTLAVALCSLALTLVRRKGGQGLLLSEDQSGYKAGSFDENLIGAAGQAISDLRPSGYVCIDGRRFQALSEGVYIKRGAQIEVQRGERAYLVVKCHTQEESIDARV